MKTALHIGRWLLLGVVAICAGQADLRAIHLLLTRNDIERALALARWPRSDTVRAQFHKRYIVTVNGPPTEYWAVEQVEVITEFRRVELMAEEHARINDNWGRGGIRDVEKSIRPWRGRVSIVVRLGLRANRPYVGVAPPVEVALGGPGAVATIDVRRTDLYANCGGDLNGCALTGSLVEQVFDAVTVGQTARPLTVLWKGSQLAHVTIDFAGLE